MTTASHYLTLSGAIKNNQSRAQPLDGSQNVFSLQVTMREDERLQESQSKNLMFSQDYYDTAIKQDSIGVGISEVKQRHQSAKRSMNTRHTTGSKTLLRRQIFE
jgi:hypothetical protein